MRRRWLGVGVVVLAAVLVFGWWFGQRPVVADPVDRGGRPTGTVIAARQATVNDDLFLASVGMSRSPYEVYRIRRVEYDGHDVTLVLVGPKRGTHRLVLPPADKIRVKQRRGDITTKDANPYTGITSQTVCEAAGGTWTAADSECT